MKIKPEHFELLEAEVNKVLEANPGVVERYKNGDFPNADKVNDLNKRFAFDVLYAIPDVHDKLMKPMYEYMDDRHVYTALKAIVPKVK